MLHPANKRMKIIYSSASALHAGRKCHLSGVSLVAIVIVHMERGGKRTRMIYFLIR